MLSCDWWAAIGLSVYCIAATAAGCWAVDQFTGVKEALKRSKTWEAGGSLKNIRENKDDEI